MRSVLLAAAVVAASAATAGPLDTCFEAAGKRYVISPTLLRAIATVESAMDPAALGRNATSYDIGLMQINSQWLPRLAHYGIAERHLWHPCVNVQVGAWILAGNIARYGHTWEAVGAYNAGTADTVAAHRRRMAYAYRIAARLHAEPGAVGRLRRPGDGSLDPRD